MSNKPKESEQPPNFEGAMDRLESIVEEMESGNLPLEQLIRHYQEGIKLVKVCQERLAGAEQKIEIIVRDNGGKPVIKEFESEATTEPQRILKKEKEGNEDARLF